MSMIAARRLRALAGSPHASRLFYSRSSPPIAHSHTLWRPTWRRMMLSPSRASLQLTSTATAHRFSTGRIVGSLVRLPALVGGSVAAAVVYIEYKVEATARYTKDVFAQGADYLSAAWEASREKLDDLADIDLPQFRLPEWLEQVLRIKDTPEGYQARSQDRGVSDQSHNTNHQESPSSPPEDPAAAALAAAVALYATADDKQETPAQAADDQMMVLTRKMIEIRNLLKQIDKSETLTLPSIVVVGSQSSGKSSVLEAIVGHEFLPKGSNMVTRRPIELTLINTPGAQAEYGTFPALPGSSKITDFAQIQATLTTLNRAVSDADCVSDDPIQLHIYSPNVPDLTLIDLPGYIQVQSKDQPANLKWKINDLCDKYIREPNIILAVCAADVDLANSPALKASRRVDPLGIRTLGVVTKMDLVTPDRGLAILKDSNYPLSLGYVGVVCRAPTPTSTGLFNRRESAHELMTRNERAFFAASPEYNNSRDQVKTGTATLRHNLMHVLEKTMASSLQSTSDAIRLELEEAQYQFKVQYNDRSMSGESYVAETLDKFKLDFKAFSEKFGKQQVREMLSDVLDQKVMDLLAERFWSDPRASKWAPTSRVDGASIEDAVHWERKLDASQSALTRMGVGRVSTQLVTTKLADAMTDLTTNGPLRSHPFAREVIENATRDILTARYHQTAEQVENCIKPFKFDVEVDPHDWPSARQKADKLLSEELRMCREASKRLSNEVGARQLSRVQEFVDTGRDTKESMGYSSALLEKGRAANFLRDRETILAARLKLARSRACAAPTSSNTKYVCPEVFLSALSQKLTETAVLFIHVELLAEFFYQFPRELDARLVRGLSSDQVDRFANEDPRVKHHIMLQHKTQLLQLALSKIDNIVQLENERRARDRERQPDQDRRHSPSDLNQRQNYWR
ncbi:mitochondrial dynamin GTPase Msp1 [Savitreella phatthalungensis]